MSCRRALSESLKRVRGLLVRWLLFKYGASGAIYLWLRRVLTVRHGFVVSEVAGVGSFVPVRSLLTVIVRAPQPLGCVHNESGLALRSYMSNRWAWYTLRGVIVLPWF